MDTAYLIEVANLLLRWAHVITAMAWIGSSFYFVMLDNSLSPPEHDDLKQKGVDGEMWAVHGGGFYHSNKYMVAPRWLPLPQNLHWSFWESYSTWLTGFALFTTLYLFNAGTYLIDKSVYDWSPMAAGASALGFLLAFWLIYDGICRTLGQRKNGDLIVGAAVTLFIIVASWLACQLFSGRAAFLLVGAMIATAMSANVFVWIIPGQKKVIASLRAGEKPDPVHGWRGKQRSVHNTYFTLPVIIAMLSNHYGWLYQGAHNWIVLVLMMLGGALIRHSFAARHKAHVQGRRTPWEHAIVGTLVIVGVMVGLAPRKANEADAASATPATLAAVQAIVAERCVACHNAQLQSKNVALHTPALIRQHAQSVYQQTVVLKLMPMNNSTQITDAERSVIRRWFEAGAKAE
jgi:uncharacterized membrane protein